MGVYSIKDLENFTQIKAHTLRIWEQRYDLLQPKRTNTNIRLYTDRDLKRILNINLLYNNGLKISKIASLNDEQIFELANEILMKPVENEMASIQIMISRIIDFDEKAILNELASLHENYSVEQVFTDLVIPVLKKVGELWQVDSISVAHEHFFSNIIRKKLIQHKDELPEITEPKGKVILFLGEDEYHELALLFYDFMLRKRGYQTFYMGQALPLEDLGRAIREIKPDYLFTSVIARMDQKQFKRFFNDLEALFPLEKVYAGGYQLKIYADSVPEKLNVVHSVDAIGLR